MENHCLDHRVHASAIREAKESDLPIMQDIERSLGDAFRAIGMVRVAEDEPLPIDVLREYQADGRAWVYVDADDRPVAYLIAAVVDGDAHIDQVSVRPDHARRRIGLALMEHMMDWGRAQGCPAATLTTFVEVAWNGPYYERCGFRYLGDEELTPGLRRIRAAEAAHGLDEWPRACMRREL
ncbi:GNAT family N-acetyltransferase [Sinosporangium siamense]|uniref:GCN5 family N-acetyltransferase n=1 Tax=Sinosporangium siamense TaxID=1367973 RepID=A0A919VA40_9ACTN|nr:GNAT family N-acetyltransferase [Sinosporangium siamense]GII94997.1 GCN5 family N-acetyltransferase [Sinosporangium siamense]